MDWSQREWSNPPADLVDVLQRRGAESAYFAFYETSEAAPREPLNRLRWIAAGGCRSLHQVDRANAESWAELALAWRTNPTWWFGILGYDLKNAFEPSLPKRGGHGGASLTLPFGNLNGFWSAGTTVALFSTAKCSPGLIPNPTEAPPQGQ